MIPEIPPIPSSPDDFPAAGPNSLASIGQRAAARVIDELLTGLPFLALLLVVFPELTSNDPAAVENVDVPLWIDLLAAAVGIGYEVVLVAWRGQTIGKMLLHIRVARFGDGKVPTWGQAALRTLLPAAIAVALAVLGGLSILVALFYLTAMLHPLRRGWHDIAGGTIVVRTR